MDNKKVSNFITLKRKEKGLTQQMVADKLNVSFQAVSKWENGTTFPNTDLLLDLSDLLGVSVDEILRGKESDKLGLTYSMAGVDLDFTDKLKKEISSNINQNNPRILSNFSDFAAMFDIKYSEYKNPVLVLKTEDPGTKQKLALDYGYVDSICHDLVNHLVNDILVMGAKPLCLLDNIYCGKAEKETINTYVKSIAQAAKENNCSLIGGKTSILKDIVDKGTYLISANIVGIVNKENIIDGSKIEDGDCIIALSSNGLHTNGYSLVRLLMEEMPHIKREQVDGQNFIDSIMKPHISYYKALTSYDDFYNINGLAHITSGGIEGNLIRILKNNLCAKIDLSKIKVHPIFKFIKNNGNVSQREMLNTFNCGVGLIVIVNNKYKGSLLNHLNKFIDAYEIGSIINCDLKDNNKVKFVNFIDW